MSVRFLWLRLLAAWNSGDANRIVGTQAWFLGRHGVFCIDGSRVTYRNVAAGLPATDRPLRLAVSPDGRTAVICPNNSGGVSVYRDGQWSERRFPGWPVATAVHALAVTDRQTLWYLLADGRLRRMTLAGEQAPTAELLQLVAELSHDDFATRERASWRLESMGSEVVAVLEGLLAASVELEQRSRLRRIVTAIRFGEFEQGFPIGSTRITATQRLYEDGRGRLLLLANRITQGADRRKGALVVESHGEPGAVIEFKPVARNYNYSSYSGEAMPPLTVTGNRVWMTPAGSPSEPGLFDLDKGTFVAGAPHNDFCFLQAATHEGRLFVASRNPPHNSSMLVYSPAARDVDPPLAIERVAVEQPTFAVGDDGAVWAVAADGGLIRFDGRKWNEVGGKPGFRPALLVPGGGGTLLAVAGNDAALYRSGTQVAANTLQALVEQERALVAEAFGLKRRVGSSWSNHLSSWNLAADRQGNVWNLVAPVRSMSGDLPASSASQSAELRTPTSAWPNSASPRDLKAIFSTGGTRLWATRSASPWSMCRAAPTT